MKRQVNDYSNVFGPKAQRIRPTLQVSNLSQYSQQIKTKQSDFINKQQEKTESQSSNISKYMNKGQSRRIWQELHKVIDSSDVICFVLDVRDPLGTRSIKVEQYLTESHPFKH